MPRVLAPGATYRGRAPGVVPVNMSLDREAYTLLQRYAPTSKSYGKFLSRLVYEYAERQRLVGKITGALAGEERQEDD